MTEIDTVAVTRTERDLADLIARYYRLKIGVCMQQAEHWAANGKPLAAHHRVHAADAYFQIVAQMERFDRHGDNPFEDMRREVERGHIKPLGAYPPSVELNRYREPEFVVRALQGGGPTPNERAGIDWWNALPEPQRAFWLRRANSARASDAWEVFKAEAERTAPKPEASAR